MLCTKHIDCCCFYYVWALWGAKTGPGGPGRGLRASLEAVGFIQAEFEPKPSHGDSIRCPNCGFGTYDMWYHGAMVPWHHGAMAPWHHGTMVPWFRGSMVPWFHGTMLPWYHGTKVPWYHGTMVPWHLSERFSPPFKIIPCRVLKQTQNKHKDTQTRQHRALRGRGGSRAGITKHSSKTKQAKQRA